MGVYDHLCRPKNFMLPPPPPFHKNDHFPKISKNDDVIKLRKANVDIRMSFFKELAKEELNFEKIDEISEKLLKSQNEMEQVVLHHFIKIRNDIPENEAIEFFTKLQNVYHNKKMNKKERHRE